MNNDKKFEKFIRDFKSINMHDQEKDHMRDALLSFADKQIDSAPIKSPYLFMHLLKRPLALALVAILVLGTTKPASASALPGEFLYKVKLIHEEIESATKADPSKKAEFEIERTETRIQEAIQLAQEDNLSPKKKESLAESINDSNKKVAKTIETIREESPEKALALSSELKTTLKSNSAALKKVVKKNKSKKNKTKIDKKPIKEVAQEEDVNSKEGSVITPQDNETEVVTENHPIDQNTAEEETTSEKNDLPTEVETIDDEALEGMETLSEEVPEHSESENEKTIEVAELDPEEAHIFEEKEELEDEEDFLINAIELDIVEVERIEEIVKEEVLNEINIETTDDATEEPSAELEKEDINTPEEVIETQESTIEPLPEDIDMNIEIDPAEEVVSESEEAETSEASEIETIAETEFIDEIVSTSEQTSPEHDEIFEEISSDGEVTALTEQLVSKQDQLHAEISSLEKVIAQKEALYTLLLDEKIIVQEKTTPDMVEKEVALLIEEKRYGEALIYLQGIIETLSHEQKTMAINEELDLSAEELLE